MSTSLHVLAQAIEDRRAAVVRCGSAAGEAQIQVQFLVDGRPGENGFWAELCGGDVTRVDGLVAGQSPVHMWFISGPHRLHFDTTILQRRRLFGRGERLLLAWPAAVRVAERRSAGREALGEQTAIVARLRAADDLPEVPLQIHDLDSRGASFVLDPTQLPAQTAAGLHICMSFAGMDHWIVAFPRHRQSLPDGRLRLGVEFDAPHSASLQNSQWFARAMEDIRACRMARTAESAA
jgi:hypothetical protein